MKEYLLLFQNSFCWRFNTKVCQFSRFDRGVRYTRPLPNLPITLFKFLLCIVNFQFIIIFVSAMTMHCSKVSFRKFQLRLTLHIWPPTWSIHLYYLLICISYIAGSGPLTTCYLLTEPHFKLIVTHLTVIMYWFIISSYLII